MSNRPRSFPPDAPAKIEPWLRYYQDIGIRSFFRDRSSGVAANITRIEAVAAKKAPATPSAPAATPRPLHDPPPSPHTDMRPLSNVSATVALPTVQPMAHGPSLFEAAARIEGDSLERVCSDIGEDCTRCKLHRQRNKIVFGAGNPNADLVFIGEGPGHDEDLQGLPFVGRAGKLLTQMIEAMGLSRSEVYIANVVKCRPPENRAPEKDEVAACMPFLLRQLSAINPKAIVCLGSIACQSLLGTNKGISQYRGRWLDYRGARLMPTYHPAYLLRNPHAKADVWGDLKKVMAFLGLKPPKPGSRQRS